MRLVAIETATVAVGAALVEDAAVLAERSVPGTRRHAEVLHPLLAELLGSTGWSPDGLDAVAVDVGPGRFVGLRVGAAAAKGLALGAGVPVVAVSSLAALAAGAPGDAGLVVPVVDMRRGEVAYALPGSERPVLATPAELAGVLGALETEVVLVGDGATTYEEELSAALGPAVSFAGTEWDAPRASTVGLLGAARLAAGGGLDPIALGVEYVRAPDARANWTTREGAGPGGAR